MAKKKSKEELDIDDSLDLNDEEESSGGNKLLNAFIVVVVIAIWLVIFGLLIKMNVGGIGSMLRPFLKNVPVINRILPEATDEEIAEETGSKYKNLAEAIDRINELEAELAQYKDAGTADSSTIADLQAEIARLKVFEDNAPDISNYKSWYESIDADNAAELYKQVIKDLEYSQKIKDWAEAYAKMDAASAAAILEEMTGDTNLVSQILQCMTSKQRAAVLAEMDPVYAAKITKITHP
jgi:flagellar motility protein MotE (MotC chaperone)